MEGGLIIIIFIWIDLPRVVRDMDHHISEEYGCVNMEEHGGVSTEVEDHDPMEDDDHATKTHLKMMVWMH